MVAKSRKHQTGRAKEITRPFEHFVDRQFGQCVREFIIDFEVELLNRPLRASR